MFRTTDGETWEQIYEVEGVSLMSVELEALSATDLRVWVGGLIYDLHSVTHTIIQLRSYADFSATHTFV